MWLQLIRHPNIDQEEKILRAKVTLIANLFQAGGFGYAFGYKFPHDSRIPRAGSRKVTQVSKRYYDYEKVPTVLN